MANPWKEKVLAFNRKRAEEGEKASDMDVLIAALIKLPPGQLKKILTVDVLEVLEKYGYKDDGGD